MKKLFPIIVFALSGFMAVAQVNCNDDILMAITGKWMKKTGYNTETSKAKQPVLRMEKMLLLLQAAYQPTGMEAIWKLNTGRQESLVKNGAYPYSLSAGFMEYFCFNYQNKTDLKLAFETPDWFFITANAFGEFMNEERGFMIENKKVYLLTPKLDELNGFPVYAGYHGNDKWGNRRFSRSVLITRAGQLPYIPVTRQQFLLAFLKYREDNYNAAVAYEVKRPRRTDAEEQILYQKGYDDIVKIKTANEKARQWELDRYVRNYVTDKQAQQKILSRMETSYQQDTKPAKDFLANEPETELQKPAILDAQYLKGAFKQFLAGDKGCMMVQLNGNYFNSKLPAYMPQLMVVDWSWGNHKVEMNFAARIEQRFDFNALQGMLDK